MSTSSYIDASLDIPNMESVPRAEITSDPVGHWKDSSTMSKSSSSLSSSESL